MKVAKHLHQNNQDTLVLLTGIMPGKGKSFGIVPYYIKPDFHDWINGKNHLKEELDYGDGLHYSNAGYELFF